MTVEVSYKCSGSVTECIRSLKVYGYAYLPEFLPAKLIDDVSEHFDCLLEQQGWIERRGADRTACSRRWFSMTPEEYLRVQLLLWAHDSVMAVFASPEVRGLAAELLGTSRVFTHPLKVARVRLPDYLLPYHVGYHQDAVEFQGPISQLTTWIALTNMPVEEGAIRIVAGSHTDGVRELQLDANSHSGWVSQVGASESIHVGDVRAGDLIVFTNHTIHGGARNRSERVHYSLDGRFQPTSEPICEMATQLPGFGYGWDTLFRDLKGKPGYSRLQDYWTEPSLRTTPYDHSFDRWRERESLDRGASGDRVAIRSLQIVSAQSDCADTRERAAELLEALSRD